MRTHVAVLVALGLSLAGLASAPVATAGEYHVYACRTPSGEAAPVDGWSATAMGNDTITQDSCPAGGALIAALGDRGSHEAGVDRALWTFTVPAWTRMAGARLWRAEDVDGGEASEAFFLTWLGGANFNIFADCAPLQCEGSDTQIAQPLAEANRISVPSADLGANLYLDANCAGADKQQCPIGRGDPNGYAAAMYMFAADVVLEQAEGPVAREVSGPLATESTVEGTSDVTFNGSDPGAGIWEVTFQIDGKLVQSTVPDENGGRCHEVGQSTDGIAGFLYLQPCPRAESADVGFNTTAIGNGAHHLIVSVLDPAGNSATVLDREINVENPVGAAGPVSPAAPAKATPKRRPVRARLTLSIEPRHVSRLQSIHFSGRVLGGSIPKGGKQLVLEAREGRGKWLKFSFIRTGSAGRYRGSYRFEFLGPGRWQIRVVCEGAVGYPFATGWSRVVRVRVRVG